MPGIVDAVMRRLPVLRGRRARAGVLSVCCFLLILALRFLYRYVQAPSPKAKRISGGGSRSSRDKKKHSSSDRSSRRRQADPTLPTVLLLVGIHGSGKSFWAKRYVEMVHKSYVVISSDAIRSRLTGTIHNYDKEDEVEAELLKEVVQTLALRRSCIVDDCQHSLSAPFRAKLRALAPDGVANRQAKIFTAKPSYAMVRIQSDLDEGMVRYRPSAVELEKQAERVVEFEKTHNDDGWPES